MRDADDRPATVADVMLLMEPLAIRIGRRYPLREGIEREDLVAEAWLALSELAPRYLVQAADPVAGTMEGWFAGRIREHLRAYVRRTLFSFLEGVPRSWHRRVIRAYVATERLKARGILRPSYEQIAGEAMLGLEVVVMAATFPRVVRRQSAVEWAEDHGQCRPADEPALVPCFGPQPGFTPATRCRDITEHPIPRESALCCMACHASGMDHRASLRRDRRAEPKPEGRAMPAAAATKPKAQGPLTRRAKRRLLFGPQVSVAPEALSA